MVQLQVTSVKADNLSRARRLVKDAAGQGSKVVLLPVRRLSAVGRLGPVVPLIFTTLSPFSTRQKPGLNTKRS